MVNLKSVKNLIIAIDGPAGSGKSTTAKLVAGRLGFLYIDTGAMYRAVTLAVLRDHIDVRDELGVATAAKASDIRFSLNGEEQRIMLNGEDVTFLIRSPEVTRSVSAVSSYAAVRQKMVELQRMYAAEGGIVMDGRDIGTVVFPAADVKVFLTASLHERAMRRRNELAINGSEMPTDEIERQLAERDEMDSSRVLSPLRKADDAVELDTTNMSIEDQVDAVIKLVKAKI